MFSFQSLQIMIKCSGLGRDVHIIDHYRTLFTGAFIIMSHFYFYGKLNSEAAPYLCCILQENEI